MFVAVQPPCLSTDSMATDPAGELTPGLPPSGLCNAAKAACLGSESRLLLKPLFSFCISVCTVQNLLSEWLFEVQEGWRGGGQEKQCLRCSWYRLLFGLLKMCEGKITSVSFLLSCWRSFKPFSLQDFALVLVNW